MLLEDLDDYVNETRGFDVDIEETVAQNDSLELDGDTVALEE
jgi:hypothetical protein